jgi:methanogenic corrinoid protein MtbC1
MADNKRQISTLLSDLDEKKTIAAVTEGLKRGDDPVLLMDQCREGVVDVGRRFEGGEYFISALIMAGEIMRQINDILLPVLKNQITGNASGRILLSTVQRDIHFIGKNIFKVMLQCTGYTVQDAGEDVAPDAILEEAFAFSPDIIGLSCLLDSCYESMHDTVAFLREGTKKLKTNPHIIIGGRVNEKVNQYVGADGWADDAMIGVRLSNRLIRS